MPTYYLNPSATGANSGANATDAWTTLQRAIDGTNGTKPGAGDTVLCYGGETVSTKIDMDGTSGLATSWVKYVGVNSSWENDGTRYVLTVSGAITCLGITSAATWIENFEIVRSGTGTQTGMAGTGYAYTAGLMLINCYFNGLTNGITNGSNFAEVTCIRCKFSSNAYGLYWTGSSAIKLMFCSFYNNTTCGAHIYAPASGVVIGCLFIGNNNGLRNGNSAVTTVGLLILNCIFHSNTTCGIISYMQNCIIGCRFTNNGTAISHSGKFISSVNYMPASGEDQDNTTNISGVYFDYLALSNFAGEDVDGGYVNSASDFNLTSSATLFSEGIPLP